MRDREPGGERLPTAADAAVRREVIASTDRTMLVEAAAGTGKTTLIVDRILQAVLDGRIRLARTVAITFTEKAAGELESRVRAGLTAALHRGGLSDAERGRVQEAVEELDRAHVCTIHAFCAHLLREKAAEAGVDPEFTVLDETPRQVLIERAWQDWMTAAVAEAPDVLVEALRAGVGAEGLKQAAFALAGAPEALEPGLFAMARPGRSRQQALDDVRRMAPEAAAVMADYMKGDGNEQSRLLRRLTAELAAADDERSARRLAYAVAGVPVEEALKSIDRDERDRAERLLAGLNAAAVDLGAHLAADVFGWLAGFVGHFGEVKRRRSELDFQDLLVLSARVLRRNLAVRRYFQRRFDAFFVDEFQDTDPLQAELIAYLCEDEATGAAQAMGQVRLAEGKLFAVGDPKQSIYRFRRADVQVYDEFKGLFAAGRFGEDRTRQVSCNFRSTGPLLAWFNRLFEHVLGLPVPEGVYQAPHVALQPPERPPEASAAPVLALCAPPGLPTAEKGWHAGDARRHEAHFIARAIEQLTGEAGACRYGDFALLFRSLTDVGYYEDALDARRIPYRVVGGKHFYRREQVAETLALLQAVDDPLNEAAVVGALRSSYFGLSDEELFRYRERGGRWNYLLTDVRSGPVGEAMGMLADWHARRNRALPHVLLREVFAATRAPQAFLLKPAGAQRVANLRKLSNQLRQLGRATGNFSAVVRHLSAVQEAELPEEESSTVEPGDDFVLLMTMHKSKGLQFGAVVLPDLGRDFGQVEKVGPLVLDRQDGSAALALGRGLRSEGYERLAERERGNQLAEVRRLLYVACTRARRLLVLPLYWWRRGDRESLQKLLMDSGCLAGPAEVPFGKERDGVRYLDIRPWLAEMEVGIGPARSAAEAREEVAPLLEERGRWQERHEALVAAASAGRRFVLPSAVEQDREPAVPGEEPPDRAGGRLFGSLFHELMAAVPLDPVGEGTAELVAGLAVVQADRLGMDGDAADQAAQLAMAALQNGEFRALLAGAEVAAREVTFAVPLGRLPVCADETDVLLEGSIDLLLELPDRTVVLDYKTDRVIAANRASVEARYWPQLALYALAARACGRVAGDLELALFLVRSGRISRRPLDEELLDVVADDVRRALEEGGS